MEKYRNIEVRVQELLETRNYDALSSEEREWVHQLMTEQEYNRRRVILEESKNLHPQAVPKPLVLKNEQRGVVVPLYQAVAGMAAAIVLTFFLVRMEKVEVDSSEPKVVAHTDTVYQDRLKLDTIYIIERESAHNRNTTPKTDAAPVAEMNTTPGTLNTVPLNQLDLENKGSSAVNDESLSLIRNFRGLN